MIELHDRDKPVLRKSQRNWLKFRGSESELIGVLRDADNSYGYGMGTMHSTISIERHLDFIKQRVFQLYEYYYSIKFHSSLIFV